MSSTDDRDVSLSRGRYLELLGVQVPTQTCISGRTKKVKREAPFYSQYEQRGYRFVSSARASDHFVSANELRNASNVIIETKVYSSTAQDSLPMPAQEFPTKFSFPIDIQFEISAICTKPHGCRSKRRGASTARPLDFMPFQSSSIAHCAKHIHGLMLLTHTGTCTNRTPTRLRIILLNMQRARNVVCRTGQERILFSPWRRNMIYQAVQ